MCSCLDCLMLTAHLTSPRENKYCNKRNKSTSERFLIRPETQNYPPDDSPTTTQWRFKMKRSFFKRTSATLIALVLLLTLFPSASAATSQFTDISRAAYPDYFDAINFVVDNGYMNGMSTTKFEPNTSLTRAMFITLLYRYDGSPTPIGSMPFEDVSTSAYYYDAVRWGANEGIVTGITDTLFNPNGAVTREQVMTFLYRYSFSYRYDLVENTYATITGKADYSSVSQYARTPMRWAVSNGLTTTVGNQSYLYPKNVAQRKEVALWLCLYDQNVVGLKSYSDIFSFLNDTYSFKSYASNTYAICTPHWSRLTSYATYDNEWNHLTEVRGKKWNGSCFGMTLTCLLDQTGQLALNEIFVDGCSDMYSIPSPAATYNHLHTVTSSLADDNIEITLIESAINYYMLSQYLDCVKGSACSDTWVPWGDQRYVLSDIIDEQRDGGILQLGIGFPRSDGSTAGHAILLFGPPVYDSSNGDVYYIDAYDPNEGITNIRIELTENRAQLLQYGEYSELDFIYYWKDNSVFNEIDLDGEYNNMNIFDVLSTTEGSEQVSENRTWLYMDPNIPATITNASGETLEIRNGELKGSMQVWDRKRILTGLNAPQLFGILVDTSTNFTYERQDCLNHYAEFTVCGPTLFGGACGDGINTIHISMEGTQIEGTDMHLTAYTSQGCPTDRYVRATIDGESFLNLSALLFANDVSVSSVEGTCLVEVISNITGMPIGEYELPAGQTLRLSNTLTDAVLIPTTQAGIGSCAVTLP